ncbi:rRNA maturation RNase YbeY [uncultured Enterovirga sp.]|uniref:rRNA maturation RNase YbeY n=1 Tax=uncultured Enterovirga sp. TaxID=2026352 RepID=UPI0035CC4066
MIALEVEIEAESWNVLSDVEALCSRAATAALAALPDGRSGDDLAATLLLADDAAVRELNRAWRDQDKPTNVLSFPAPPLPGSPRHLGDIALAYETVAREAEADGKSVADHASHLVVHGLLHLLGHDHGNDREAEIMEGIEIAALARLGIPDPYRSGAAVEDRRAAP